MSPLNINGVRYDDRESGGHVESYFFKATAPDAERAFWIKTTIFLWFFPFSNACP